MTWRSAIFGLIVVLTLPQMGFGQDSEEPSEPPIPPNHFVPAVDIFAFDFLLNRYGYHFLDRPTYDVTAGSIRRNVQSAWVVDNDPFDINQFLHPYQGAMYHGFARSVGLGYWESMGFTFAGSVLWELAGETTVPSKNDQIASGIGGSFLGEPLFRLAELIVRRPNHRFWRELSALVISPSTGFNRLAYGDRFNGVDPGHDPAVFTRVQFGAMGTASIRNSLTQPLTRNEAVADFTVEYGLPGKPGYAYHRPFDYFDLQFTSSTGSRFESIFSRGLLAGRSYGEGGDRSRGVWGLYGSYDYVAPQIFRVSSVALSLGNTAQWTNASTSIQSTVLAGVGWRGRRIRQPRLDRLSLWVDAAGARQSAIHSRRQSGRGSDIPRLLREPLRLYPGRIGEHRPRRRVALIQDHAPSCGLGALHLVTPRHIRERPAVRRRPAIAWIGRTVLHVSWRHAFRRRGVLIRRRTARGSTSAGAPIGG